MCCQTGRHHAFGNCGFHHSNRHFPGCGPGPHFLSKKKKIQLLEEHAEDLRERAKDIEDYLNELKEKK